MSIMKKPLKYTIAAILTVTLILGVFFYAAQRNPNIIYTPLAAVYKKMTNRPQIQFGAVILPSPVPVTVPPASLNTATSGPSSVSSSSPLTRSSSPPSTQSSSLSSTLSSSPSSSPAMSILEKLGIDRGETWSDSFCDEFLSHKFKVDVTPCAGTERLKCYGSPYDDKMGSCHYSNLAIDIPKYYDLMHTRRDSIIGSNVLWLVPEKPGLNFCPKPAFSKIDKYLFGGDYVKKMAKSAILAVPQGECTEWIEGDTVFFMGFDVHIYFKVLSWYSLHNGLANIESTGQINNTVIRIPESRNTFLFPEFEKRMFPEANVYSLEELSTKKGIVCFRRATVVPWAYSSTPFRCKMADSAHRIRSKCYHCNSRNLPGTRFQSFRRRVLNACSIKDSPRPNNEIKKILVELRKPYHRFIDDNPSKFARVLKNPDRLVNKLKETFPTATVETIYPEDLPMCEQVKKAHDCDIFIGVHGAGLVHLWWMQDEALLFEIVPGSQIANPTFKMLSALTGKRYYGFSRTRGSDKEVIVDVNQVISELNRAIRSK